MGFHATNFTVTVLLLVAFTVFMAGVRNRKAADNNWPIIYWFILMLFVLFRPEESWDIRILLIGFVSALLLRFEFLNDTFIKIFRVIEMVIFVYIVLRGIQVAFS